MRMDLYTEYRRERKQGAYPLPAKVALQIVKARHEAPEHDWKDDGLGISTTFEREGFQIQVSFKVDDYPDMSWLGEFTDEASPEAVENPWPSEQEADQQLRDLEGEIEEAIAEARTTLKELAEGGTR
jgi:hypothetical protein